MADLIKISDSIDTESSIIAASSTAVKAAYDLAAEAAGRDVGVTSFNGSTGAVTYSAPVTSVNGATGAVTVGTVRSVNGVSADAAGNVALTTGTVSQKLSTSVTVNNSSVTKTVSGLTAYKPAIIGLKLTSGDLINMYISSGTALNASTYNVENRVSEPGATMWYIVIPNGTSISIVVSTTWNSNNNAALIVYQ